MPAHREQVRLGRLPGGSQRDDMCHPREDDLKRSGFGGTHESHSCRLARATARHVSELRQEERYRFSIQLRKSRKVNRINPPLA